MSEVETYSLAMIFYVLIGVGHGVSNACITALRSGVHVRLQGYYFLCGGVALVYAILGLSAFAGGLPLYTYLPVVIIWWAGKEFGASIFPISDKSIGGAVIGSLIAAVAIYHVFL